MTQAKNVAKGGSNFDANGVLQVSGGGTGATTQAAAAAAVLPTQTGNSGKYLTTNGTDTSWGTVTSNPGTVTNVTGTAPVSVATGTSTPVISMSAASAGVDGYMTGTYASKLDGVAAGATNVTNTNQLTNGSGYITTDGRAYPRQAGGGDINFNWSGAGGQPSWLWGGNDGTNMYVYNPSNFSVNYATTAGNGVTATSGSPAYYGARAWVNWITGTIQASVNVSSVSRTGTGLFQVNFTTAMPDTNYVISGSAQLGTDNAGTNTLNLGPSRIAAAFSTGSCSVTTLAGNGTAFDGTRNCLVIHR